MPRSVLAVLLLLAPLAGCAPVDAPSIQVIDVRMIGPILAEMRREIALYDAGAALPPTSPASPNARAPADPAASPAIDTARPTVSFVLPNPPPEHPPIAIRALRAPSTADCPPPQHFIVQSATLALVVSTDRTLTRGLTATLPLANTGSLSLTPGSTRETISTETLQFTEYPRPPAAHGRPVPETQTRPANPRGQGLAQALGALEGGLRQDVASDGPCFSAMAPDPATLAAIPGPDQITFALDASRTSANGLALTLGVIGLQANFRNSAHLANTITIVFRAAPDISAP